MLRLSKLSDYATVIMVHMAGEAHRFHSAGEVAEAVAMSLPTASKLLKILAGAGVLVSQRGAKGGYALARPAREISMAQIVDAVEGPIGVTECNVAAGLCMQEAGCRARSGWQRINRVIREALEHTSLAEFAQPGGGVSPMVFGATPLGRPDEGSKQDGTRSASTR